MSGSSVHLILRRCGHGLDRLAKLLVDRAGKINVEPQTCGDNHLLFVVARWRDAKHCGAQQNIELAAHVVQVDQAVDDPHRDMFGLAQRYQLGAGRFGGVGQNLSSIGSVGTTDVARSPAAAPDGRLSVAIPRAA